MKLILLLSYQVFKLILMKKKIIVLAFLAFTSLIGAEVFKHSGRAFSAKCAECIKESKKNTWVQIQIATRTFDYKRKDGKIYAKYSCQGGHSYWAELE